MYDVGDEGDTEVEVVSHGEGINTDRGDTFLTECSSQHWEHTGGALLPYQGGAGGGGGHNTLLFYYWNFFLQQLEMKNKNSSFFGQNFPPIFVAPIHPFTSGNQA